MAVDPNIRQIARDQLYAVFRSPELVRLFESVLFAVRETIPSSTDAVQQALDAHIADPDDAHQASAIGFIPVGGITSNEVQGAIAEVDAGKQPLDGTLTALATLTTAADRLPYFTGPDAAALAVLTAFGRTLVAVADAAAGRSALGLGTIATQDAANVAVTGGSIALASGAFGYAAGNGGAVVQATSKSTGVTLDKIAGEITMNGAALAGGAAVSFTLTNSTIAATDRIIVNHQAAGTFGAYMVDGRCGAGSATIVVRNLTGGSLSEAIVLGFAVVKSANS